MTNSAIILSRDQLPEIGHVIDKVSGQGCSHATS